MAVRPEYMLLSDRLLRSPGLSQMVLDPPVHDPQGGPYRRGLHAYGLGAFDPDLCHSAAAHSGVSVRGHHGVRGGLHVLYPVELLLDGVLTRGDPSSLSALSCRVAGLAVPEWRA